MLWIRANRSNAVDAMREGEGAIDVTAPDRPIRKHECCKRLEDVGAKYLDIHKQHGQPADLWRTNYIHDHR